MSKATSTFLVSELCPMKALYTCIHEETIGGNDAEHHDYDQGDNEG